MASSELPVYRYDPSASLSDSLAETQLLLLDAEPGAEEAAKLTPLRAPLR